MEQDQSFRRVRRAGNSVDIHVGGRVRLRRKSMGVTQQRLAAELGVTFQQVQKYELGTNRISASKLFEISRVLKSSIEIYFEGLEDGPLLGWGGDLPVELSVKRFLLTHEGQELAETFPRIRHAKHRRRILELVRTLADWD